MTRVWQIVLCPKTIKALSLFVLQKVWVNLSIVCNQLQKHWSLGVEVGTTSNQNSETCLEMRGKYLIQSMGDVAQPVQFGNNIQIMFLLETFKWRLHLSLEFPLAQLQHQNKKIRSKQPFWLNCHWHWDFANVLFWHDLSACTKEYSS